jgi:hypothetical protein
MAGCEFEEKEYETQMTLELGAPPAGRRYLIAPGQALEHLLGYDVAADASDDGDPIWAALSTPRPPGVRLLPTSFPPAHREKIPVDRLPSQPVSLFLQYKRPYLVERRSRLVPIEVPLPSYRVDVDEDQQAVLRHLDQEVEVVPFAVELRGGDPVISERL